MSTRHGLVRLDLTIRWPVLAGGVAVLLFSALAGCGRRPESFSPPRGSDRP